MAILKTASIGVGTKSLGDNSYKTVRGRTIASRRIVENKSKTPAQTSQRTAFGTMCKAAKVLSVWIDQAIIKTKYGSQRNSFMRQNAAILAYLKSNSSNLTGHALAHIAQAIDAGVVVYSGFGSTFADAEYTRSTDALSAVITFSRPFAIGDTISLLIAQTYGKKHTSDTGYTLISSYADAKIHAYTLLASDVTGTNVITIDKSKIPALSTCCVVPTGYTPESLVFAVSVQSQKEISTSYLISSPVESGEAPDEL